MANKNVQVADKRLGVLETFVITFHRIHPQIKCHLQDGEQIHWSKLCMGICWIAEQEPEDPQIEFII